jgi:hypothetical protein
VLARPTQSICTLAQNSEGINRGRPLSRRARDHMPSRYQPPSAAPLRVAIMGAGLRGHWRGRAAHRLGAEKLGEHRIVSVEGPARPARLLSNEASPQTDESCMMTLT